MPIPIILSEIRNYYNRLSKQNFKNTKIIMP